MKYFTFLFIFFAVFALSSCLPPYQPVSAPEYHEEPRPEYHHDEPPRPEYHHDEPPRPEYHHDEPPRPEYHHDEPVEYPRVVSGHDEEPR